MRRAMVRVCSERPHSSTSDSRCPGVGVSSVRGSGTSAARCSRWIASLPAVTRSWYPSARAGPAGEPATARRSRPTCAQGRPAPTSPRYQTGSNSTTVPVWAAWMIGVGTVGARSHVHHDMVDAGTVEVVEEQVARLDLAERDVGGLVVLDRGRVQQAHARGAPGEHRQPRAVQAAGAGPSPLVGDAEVPLGARQGGRPRSRGAWAAPVPMTPIAPALADAWLAALVACGGGRRSRPECLCHLRRLGGSSGGPLLGGFDWRRRRRPRRQPRPVGRRAAPRAGPGGPSPA